jgi:Arc/MetJ-type ribon-helix-helix transcriptional regulator
MSTQIAIRIPERDVVALDAAVAGGRFESRAAAVREGIGRLLSDEREREIAERYRRAYGSSPEEEVWGRVGAEQMARSVRELERVSEQGA